MENKLRGFSPWHGPNKRPGYQITLWRKLQDDLEDAVGDHTNSIATPLFDFLYDADIIIRRP